MKLFQLPLILISLAAATAQAPSQAVIANLDTANWTHEKGDPPGSEGVMLHADPVTGGMDLLVRFPAGHVTAPHFHDSNERIMVAEGQLTLRRDSGSIVIKSGGYAYLPATRSSGSRAPPRRGARSTCRGTANPLRIRPNRALAMRRRSVCSVIVHSERSTGPF